MLSLLSSYFFFLTLDLILLVNDILAVGKVELNLWESGTVIVVNPAVLQHISHLGASGWVKLQETSDEVFEFLREVLCTVGLILRMSLPEKISTVGTDQSVERISGLSSSERWVLSIHNEKNNGGSEKIY